MSGTSSDFFVVRSFQSQDVQACQRLYVDGLIGGKIADDDKAPDIEDIRTAYMRKRGNHFWVAVLTTTSPANDGRAGAGAIVGMVGVQHPQEGVGEIRRLRVAKEFRRRGIGTSLMETALRFCEERQYLKITLDTFMDREPAVALFQKFHFHPCKTRKVGEKELVYFYLDLYGNKRVPGISSAGSTAGSRPPPPAGSVG